MKVYLTIPIFFIGLASVNAQTDAGLPVQFIQFFRTYNLINPSGIGRDSSLDIRTGNKSLLGAFSGVRTFYAIASKQLGKSSSRGTKHALGANFINDKEGTYINKTRASLMYAAHIPLSLRLALNAGVAIGFINYSFKATDINAGGSDFAPNADVGLWLQRSDLNIGISINQIIPAKLTPIDETYTISKFYNLLFDKDFLLNHNLSVKSALVFRYSEHNSYNLDLGLLTFIQKNILAGITYKYQKGFSLCAGLENLQIKNEVFHFTFSYYYPSYKFTYYNSQAIEISLGFKISKDSSIKEYEDN
jgi:type IX secretion system PorP/SprF family membrane protein